MAYLISIAARAERDLAHLYDKINAASSGTALKWYKGLRNAILSLEEAPNRCLATREKRRLRHLLYGHKPNVYRIIHRVLERQKRVEVLHLHHGARRSLKPTDLE